MKLIPKDTNIYIPSFGGQGRHMEHHDTKYKKGWDFLQPEGIFKNRDTKVYGNP